MCIICNCGDTGDAFLLAHTGAANRMKLAAEAMLKCAMIAPTPEQRRQYDRTHKKIVRQLRDWNRLEQERETHDH